MPWEHFSHQADMGIRGHGASKEEAFEQAALALTAVITDLDKVEPLTSVTRAGIASIGGAGTFDGIVFPCIVAAYLT